MAGLIAMGTRRQEGTCLSLSPALLILTGDKTGDTAVRPPQLSPLEGDAAPRGFQAPNPISCDHRLCIERASARLKAGACA